MRKKKYYVIGLFFMSAMVANAQSGMVSSGGEATGDGSVSFSVGQVAYMSVSGEGGSILQGVQQAYVIKEETGIEISEIQLTAYPNPTTDMIFSQKNLVNYLETPNSCINTHTHTHTHTI